MVPACHPDQIGRYAIAGVLGHGGMGTVYRALVPESERIVALKLLQPAETLRETLGMAALRKLFNAEIRIMSGLSHPNIAEVLDCGEDHDRPFFTMDYFCANLGLLIGEQDALEESCRRVPLDRAVAYGSQILAGLAHMHAAGVIHRDIKPANMMLSDEGTIKISDFGMGRRLREEPFAAHGVRVGSPYYCAPEQLGDPAAADTRSDLYSTGALLYRLLTGELPTMKGFMLSQVNGLYDPAWDAFFAKALRWQPDRRFQDSNGMRQALLHLEPHPDRSRSCGQILGATINRFLRSSPLHVTGETAREAFEVDRLWQPRLPPCGRLTGRDVDTLRDETSGLLWQHRASAQPVDRQTALDLVAAMNGRRFAGIDSWRLPTVNELLSLTVASALPRDSGSNVFLAPHRDWLWSCDQRSTTTSWYVNIALGYVGWQHNSCRFAVRAVASDQQGPHE